MKRGRGEAGPPAIDPPPRPRASPSSVAALKGFADWLVNSEGKSPNTARAYKSWAAKAMVERGAHDPHVLSAVKTLARYQASKRRP
jgi:hypothetical protein